ncbi:MAG: hypothetical protein ACTSYF_00915 [Promethearchaeota archaeon]
MCKMEDEPEDKLKVMLNFLALTKEGKYCQIDMDLSQYPRVEEEGVEVYEECHYLLGMR